MTHLLALVSAPPLEATAVRRVEVILLQPQLVLVVVITATGGVTKRLFTFRARGRPGPRRVGGRVPERAASAASSSARACCVRASRIPSSPCGSGSFSPSCGRRSRTSLEAGDQALYVGGTGGRPRRVPRRGSRRLPAAPRGARAARGAPRAHAREPGLEAAVRARRLRVRRSRARARLARRRAVRPAAPEPRDSQPRSGRCGWTTSRPSMPSARPRGSSPVSSKRSTRTERRWASSAREGAITLRVAILGDTRGSGRVREGDQVRVQAPGARAPPGRLRPS